LVLAIFMLVVTTPDLAVAESVRSGLPPHCVVVDKERYCSYRTAADCALAARAMGGKCEVPLSEHPIPFNYSPASEDCMVTDGNATCTQKKHKN